MILVCRRWRQEDCNEFEGRLVYIKRGYKKPGFFLTHTKKKNKGRKEEAGDVCQTIVLAYTHKHTHNFKKSCKIT